MLNRYNLSMIFNNDTKKVFNLAIPAALKHLADILQILVDMIMVGYISVQAFSISGTTITAAGSPVTVAGHQWFDLFYNTTHKK